MYAYLGSIKFRGVFSPSSLSSSYSANLARLELIQGKPDLQKVGQGLEELSLSIGLHSMFCDPETELSKLYDYAEKSEVVPLIFGSGVVFKNFVIQDINLDFEKQDTKGRIIACTVAVTLIEAYRPDEQVQARSQAFASSRNNPPGAPTVTRQVGAPGQFTMETVAAAAATTEVNRLLAEAEANPALEASNLARTNEVLEQQWLSLERANAVAQTPSLTTAASAFLTALSGFDAAITAMQAAVANNLASAIIQNQSYQATLGNLPNSTVQVAALKAIRRP